MSTSYQRTSEVAFTICKSLAEMTTPKADRHGFYSPKHEGNWPLNAVYAIEYMYFDKQFPDVKHSMEVEYFDTKEEYMDWLKEKSEWVRGTDYDFNVTYTLYEWELGVNKVFSGSIP